MQVAGYTSLGRQGSFSGHPVLNERRELNGFGVEIKEPFGPIGWSFAWIPLMQSEVTIDLPEGQKNKARNGLIVAVPHAGAKTVGS
jgi:hypothetical protein